MTLAINDGIATNTGLMPMLPYLRGTAFITRQDLGSNARVAALNW